VPKSWKIVLQCKKMFFRNNEEEGSKKNSVKQK